MSKPTPQGKATSGPSATQSRETDMELMCADLHAISSGDFSKRVGSGVKDPALAKLSECINKVVVVLEERAEEMHTETMDLALGLSESFQVLSDVRSGNLDSRVSEATLESKNELLSKFGAALNSTTDEIRQTIERLEAQRYAIRSLSTPVLEIWEDVLALPVIGIVDSERGADIMEKLLAEIVAKQARYVILDITGVEMVDTRTADQFLKVVTAAQLLGAECMLTGTQPAVAQTLVELGVDLGRVSTYRTLRDGLRECARRLRRRQQTRVSLLDAIGEQSGTGN